MEFTVPQPYLEDASGFSGSAERLFLPESDEAVARILREASAAGVPVTVAGAGTGLTGGRVPQGGWVLSTEKLRLLEIHGGHALAGAGVALRDLQAAAAASGQRYPPDPTEWTASVGGTIATNASGSRSFRCGATRRWVNGLTVALMDGTIRHFRRGEKIDFPVSAIPAPDTTKNTAGYALAPGMDWMDLFIGSEGTLGVVTHASLTLVPVPRSLITGVVFFESDPLAVAAVDQWRLVPGTQMLEYFDRGSLLMLRSAFPEIPETAFAAVLCEAELGSRTSEASEGWLDRLDAAGADVEASRFAVSDQDRERFRRIRHALPGLVNDMVRRNGFTKLGSDYAVPIGRNLEMLGRYRKRLDAEFEGQYVIFGHIGDAHLHVNILPASQREFDRGQEVMIELAREAVALGGTVSAEHGLGKRKKALLDIQYPREAIEAMIAVKRRLDPHMLLGRGNLFSVV